MLNEKYHGMKEYSRFNEVRQIFVSLLLGGMLFCSCATDCMDDVLHSNTSVDKVDEKSGRGSEMYDYIYAEVKNIDLTKYPNSALKVYPFRPAEYGSEMTEIPQIESIVMYTREEPDRAHTTVLLKVHDDRFDMDFPVNSIGGEIVPARIFMPCSFETEAHQHDLPLPVGQVAERLPQNADVHVIFQRPHDHVLVGAENVG